MLLVRCRRFFGLSLAAVLVPAWTFLSPAHASLSVAGGDLSALGTLEQWGAVYRADGKPIDALIFFRQQGANCFRLRLFVNPTGEGVVTNSLPYTIAMAKRVKASGAQLLLDIHYSDTWADPANQTKPTAWSQLPFDQLVSTVKAYTQDVLVRFQKEDVSPDFVQLGNEITNGMLWPDGRIEYEKPKVDESWNHLSQLLKAAHEGLDAAYESAGPRPKVILHIESTADTARSVLFFQNAVTHGVLFDVAAFSYYPEWHGGIRQLRTTLSEVATTFHKPVLVVETAYPWKDDIHWKNCPNMDWPISPAGQEAFLRAVSGVVREVPQGLGLGVVYWYPESVLVENHHIWLGGSCALFAKSGEALPAITFARQTLSTDLAEKAVTLFRP